MSVEWRGAHVRIRNADPIIGTVALPGSKSLTNRYLACAALADGPSVITSASRSDDTHAMCAGLRALGARVEAHPERPQIAVAGCPGAFREDDVAIDVGDAGTAMRFLTALACLGFGRRWLDGSARMRQRPIGGLVDALNALGAHIEYDQRDGHPPLTVAARGLTGGEVVLETSASSQFLSALLLAAPYAGQDVMIRVEGELPSRPYVEMTLGVMRAMGVEALTADGTRYIVPAFQRYQAGPYAIEPDASAATYFWAAAAITGGRVRVAGLTRASTQGDVRFADTLAQVGCSVQEGPEGLAVEGPARGRLRGVAVDMNDMPDVVPTLAVVALFADGPTEIRNVANLRLKETDRLAALATELTRLGARVEARPDGLTIRPPERLRPAEINTYGDHRMAMSLALAGLGTEGVVIREAGCVSKSFPGFFDALAELGP
ncbi:MAG: 3-phosphoshikimate 1-carboxyvinyltransferase [Planctomycetota bacterium]